MSIQARPLAELVEINPSLPTSAASDELAAFVPMAALDAETASIRVEEVRAVGEMAAGYSYFQSGDILIAKITPCFQNSKIAQAVVPTNHAFGSTEFHVLRPKSSRIHGRYLLHFLRQEWVLREGERKMTGSAGQRRVPKHFLESLLLPTPPIEEQRRIAVILDQAEALRAKRRAALDKLDSLAQSIFIEMFGDPATNPLALPVVPLINVAYGGFQNGAYFPKEKYSTKGIEMVHMSDAFGGVVERGHLKRVACEEDEAAKYSLTEDDILIARRSLTYEGAAKPCRVPKSKHPLIFESSFIRIRPDLSKVNTPYLFHFLDNDRVREKFVRPYVTQSTISGINQSNLARIPLMLPPTNLQDEFSIRLETIHRARILHVSAIKLSDLLFGSLQHRAFRGEL